MAKTITYTNSATNFVVTPTRTPITNGCEKPLTLTYESTSEVVEPGKTVTASKKIVSINYAAKNLYASIGPSYVIPAGSKATITSAKSGNLSMAIS